MVENHYARYWHSWVRDARRNKVPVNERIVNNISNRYTGCYNKISMKL